MIWTRVEHEKNGLQLVLSDSDNGDVDLRLGRVHAEELGRALFLGGSAYGVEAVSADGESATLSASQNEISVTLNGEKPYRFVLEPEDARALGASILERPVINEVECPNCGRHSREDTTVARSSEIAEARARSEHWKCPHCGYAVIRGELVGYEDDVWRVAPGGDA
jgi:predicted RNA-binding Zn-ribbon protein involved in translation (DUF1610 family)